MLNLLLITLYIGRQDCKISHIIVNCFKSIAMIQRCPKRKDVCNTSVLWQNGRIYDNTVFTDT